jgi:hypothetical protein
MFSRGIHVTQPQAKAKRHICAIAKSPESQMWAHTRRQSGNCLAIHTFLTLDCKATWREGSIFAARFRRACRDSSSASEKAAQSKGAAITVFVSTRGKQQH